MSPESVTSLAQKRVRRQKQIIAVGSVVLLVILGFELPKFLGGGGNSASPAAPAAVPNAAPVPVAPVGKLPNTDRVVVVRDSNQLISFGLFKSKDPFVQQLSTTPSGAGSETGPTPVPAPSTPPPSGSTPPATGGTPTTATTPSSTTGGSVVPGATPGATTPGAPAAGTEALIATNGVCERVSVDGTFPINQNIFRLASVAKDGKSVEVGIVGGSFDSGKPTATLKQGGKLTLVNTADGTRYVIELKASCSVIAQAATTTATQTTTGAPPVTTTAPAPAPTTTTTATTTATTPIVTDSLDTTTPSS